MNVSTRCFHSAVAIFKIPVAKLEQRMSLNVTDLLLNMQCVFVLTTPLFISKLIFEPAGVVLSDHQEAMIITFNFFSLILL